MKRIIAFIVLSLAACATIYAAEKKSNTDLSKRLLLIVDPQVDFITGTLPVAGAEEKMKMLGDYLRENGAEYAQIVITSDWHPANHSSFSANGGQWPAHCIQNSQGAAITDDVYQPAIACSPRVIVLTKGTEAPTEEYSIFANAVSGPELCKIVNENNLEGVDICGIAGDFCVLNTAKDALKAFGKEKIRILTDFVASIDDGTTINTFIAENGLPTTR